MHLQTTATEITQTGYSTTKSSNQSIVHCILRDACHELFCMFGGFYASGMHDAEITKSLKHDGDNYLKDTSSNPC